MKNIFRTYEKVDDISFRGNNINKSLSLSIMLKLCLILTLALIQTNAFAPMRNPCNYNDDCNDYTLLPLRYCVVNELDGTLPHFRG